MHRVLGEIDFERLSESYDLEVKKALGRRGQGELPNSFWETYSAMANTEGGVVLLGVEEKPRGHFTPIGISDPNKVVKSLFDGANNRQQVSVNLLSDKSIEAYEVGEGLFVLRIEIPRAGREYRPVHVGENPLTGTYKRNFEGDYLCRAEEVRRMLAEQIEDERDRRLLKNFFIDDLDLDSVASYKNLMAASKPGHPWLEHDTREFLRCLQVWRRDRDTGESALTLAGLLMFGKLPSILEAVPHYVVDYHERPEPKTELRWIDRVTTDGTWSGNLFDFYRLVSKRLFTDLKVPFRLVGEQRVDETPIHGALREALVNSLIHADFSGPVSVLVVKRPDLFGFRNPGLMRLPPEDAIKGGVSDCRNRILQKMFQLVGLGEQAGSGVPKIFSSWAGQHWRTPNLEERREPEQTILTLRMMSLLPDETVVELDRRFGGGFRQLSRTHRLALATAAVEGQVTHARLNSITADHPRDLTLVLRSLVEDGFLESVGATRATRYFLPGSRPSSDREILEGKSGGSEDFGTSSEDLGTSSEDLGTSSEDLSTTPETWAQARRFAAPIRNSGRAPREMVREAILSICSLDYFTLKVLADLLGRTEETVRQGYLSAMVKHGDLIQRYPSSTHPKQAYRTAEEAVPAAALDAAT